VKASTGFYLISDQEDVTSNGRTVFLAASLYEDRGADRNDGEIRAEDRGEERGALHGFLARGQRGLILCSLTFDLGTGDTITATGVLPSGAQTVERGVLALVGGTGRFRGWTGEVRLEAVTNPKRWSIDGGG
jgi:hypothetical protein